MRRRDSTQLPPTPGEGEVADAVADLVVHSDEDDRRARARRVGRLAQALAHSAKGAGAAALASGRWLADVVLEVAPRLPLRDLPTLIAHHRGATGDALAQALIRSASRATAGVGAVGGGVASVQALVPPTYVAVPAQLAAETLAIVAIELKLVAELHEVYGAPLPGPLPQRGATLVQAWAERRGVKWDLTNPAKWGSVVTPALRRQLTARIARRMGRNVSTLMPFLTGAAVGAELNRRATRAVGEAVAATLRDA